MFTYTYIHSMGTKTISLSDEAYSRLKAEKREGESFTQVVNRLTRKTSLLKIAGFLKKEEAEEMEKVIKEMREKSRARTLKIIEEMK